MKTLILAAAMVLSAAAHADTMFVTPNRMGGLIEFTNEPCRNTKANAMVISSNPANGNAITGCWMYSETAKAFRVRWDDGSVSSFGIDTMRFSEAFERKMNEVKAQPSKSAIDYNEKREDGLVWVQRYEVRQPL